MTNRGVATVAQDAAVAALLLCSHAAPAKRGESGKR
jgi:hypothetical protein